MQITFGSVTRPVMQAPRFGSQEQSVDQKVVGLLKKMERTLTDAQVNQFAELTRDMVTQNFAPSEMGVTRRGEVFVLFTLDTKKAPFNGYENDYYRVLYTEPGEAVRQLTVSDVRVGHRQAPKYIHTREGVTIGLPAPSFVRNRDFTETQVNGRPVVDSEFLN